MDAKPMTIGELIASLEVIRAHHGADVPVVLADFKPVLRAGVLFAVPLAERVQVFLRDGVADVPERPFVVITDRCARPAGEQRR
jgi:hypothetical protein